MVLLDWNSFSVWQNKSVVNLFFDKSALCHIKCKIFWMLSLMSSFRLTWWINSVFLELLQREDVLCFIFGFKLSVEPDETFTFQTLSAEKVSSTNVGHFIKALIGWWSWCSTYFLMIPEMCWSVKLGCYSCRKVYSLIKHLILLNKSLQSFSALSSLT